MASPNAPLPVVDFSALISSDPDQRFGAVCDLGRACREWGSFILVNHGMPETLMSEVITLTKEFYSLPDSEKMKYKNKISLDPPIKYGSPSTFWREYLNFHVHPTFHCPQQPQLLRKAVEEYSEIARKIAIKLMEGVCDALELDRSYVEETLKMDSSFQLFATNYYPRCPRPDQETGLPPHTDIGLLIFLTHDGVAGLQIEHDGKWFNAVSPQNSLLVHAGDQLEILSNGRYKSVVHRVVVNEERGRMSIVVANGPSEEAVVAPAAALVEKDGRAMYKSMKYKDYKELKYTILVGEKTPLEKQKIN